MLYFPAWKLPLKRMPVAFAALSYEQLPVPLDDASGYKQR